ncbi:hypothetical protein [Mycolicibacterium canariasense]|uniref:hypothetical protein n=1 Tax=Mycolicibacterium canariasense TaxID=228230 RepID=UPI000A166A32|nr:hypothetical protein [Mycolicibacterium canariasense]MCV7208375.1 hypothetical protein [Mycolicibacterium canariasense]ORV13559.1 hypothetical protein AWB94_04880 [Mycolicibacterium canariasense]
MNNVITISGDRQAGKTHAALSVVAGDAMRGQRAVYVGQGWHYIDHAHSLLLDGFLPAGAVERVRHSRADQRIELVGGGVIRYLIRAQFDHPSRTRHETIRSGVDSIVFDDVLLPPRFAEDHPDTRIYVTETVGAAATAEERTAALIRAARVFVHGEEDCPMQGTRQPCIAADCPVHRPGAR